MILFYLAENEFNLVGRAPALNWVHVPRRDQASSDVTVELDERTAARPRSASRRHYRFQLQGPNALKMIETATGKPAPDLKFFNMAR